MSIVEADLSAAEVDKIQQSVAVLENDPTGLVSQIIAQKKSSDLFDQVYEERRLENYKELVTYDERRIKYFLKHAEILEAIQDGLLFKVSQAKSFILETVKYHMELAWIYENFSRRLNEVGDFDRLRAAEVKHKWYGSVEKGFLNFLLVKDQTVKNNAYFNKWLHQNLGGRLTTALNNFLKAVNEFQTAIDKTRLNSADKQKSAHNKFQKMKKKLKERDEPFDLMCQQLEIIQFFSSFNLHFKQWGHLVSSFWDSLHTHEVRLFSTVKSVMKDLSEEMMRLYSDNEQLYQLKRYWNAADIDQQPTFDQMFNIILKADHQQFIRSSLNRSVNSRADLEAFFKLEHVEQVVGNPEAILRLLAGKTFSVKIDVDRNQKRWSQGVIHITIDNYLVFRLGDNLVYRNKMQLKRIKNKRLTEQMVSVVEYRKTFFITTKNIECIHFNSVDETEQFLFLTEKDLELKKLYLQ